MNETARNRRELWIAIAIGLFACAVRIYYLVRLGGMYHPDEIFQYLEPAHWKIHGFGHLAWEFDRGARNFALSGLYSHLLRIGDWLDLGRAELYQIICCCNALLSLFLVPACWRLGELLAPARRSLAWGLALLAALFPVFGYFSVYCLSELHALVLATWAHVAWLDLRAETDPRRQRQLALACGFLFGLSFIIRYVAVALLVVASIDLLLSPRRRQLHWYALGLLAPIAYIGVVDKLEWGRFLGSLREYIIFNTEKGASTYGVEPWFYYLVQLREMFGVAAPLVGLGLLIAVVTRTRLTLAWVVPLAFYSATAHKELRFVLPLLALLLAAAVAGIDDGLNRVARWLPPAVARRALPVLAGTLLVGVLASTQWTVQGWSRGSRRGYFAAEALAGAQGDATGLLIGTTRFFTGGYTLVHRNIPFEFFSWELADHRLFNYAAISEENQLKSMMIRRDFELIGYWDDVYLFRRRTDRGAR